MRKIVKTSVHRKTGCPHCGYKVDHATSLQGKHTPAPGSVTVCIKCAGVSQYTETMDLASFDPALLDPEAADLVAKARKLILSRRPS